MLNGKSEFALKRAEIMKSTNDGFVIAEEDLKLRGPGEIFGTRQHGVPGIHFADLMKHVDVLEMARKVAQAIVSKDSELESAEYAGIRKKVEKLFKGNIKLEL